MKRVKGSSTMRKSTAWILSAALVLSACPVTAEAEELTENGSESVSETDQTMDESETAEGENTNASEEEKGNQIQGSSDEDDIARESAQETSTQEASTEEASTEETSTEETSTEETVEEATEKASLEAAAVYMYASAGNVTRTCPAIGKDGEVTFHYYPQDGEKVESAYVKGSWSGDWSQYFYMTVDDNGVWSATAQLSLEKSYEYGIVVNDNWVGDSTNPCSDGNSEILRNPVYNSDGSISIFYYPTGDEQVSLLYKTADDNNYHKVTMTQDAYHSALLSATVSEQGEYTYCLEVNGVQTDDLNCSNAAFHITKLPEDDASVKSPVVNGNEVTFHYFAPTADSVSLAGQMNDWNPSADAMTYNEKTGFWSITRELADGKYEYKFVINGGTWVTDPRNDLQSSGNSLVQVGEDKDPEQGAYQYTIYYLDANHKSVDGASLWIWSDNVNGTQYFFQDTEELADGNIWLKAEVSSDYEVLYIIPRAYDDWAWQDVDKSYDNEQKQENVTLYLVNGDASVYTELPEIVERESRYVIVEYDRPAGDYDGWNIYSWNTGYGSDVSVGFEKLGDKMAARIPVVDTKESISFCMRKSETDNEWAEKDGGDHTVAIPLDQSVVKASFIQGEGIVYNLPYNIGYITDSINGEITFYYRDDTLFRNYEEAALKDHVELIWDDEKYPMSYDETNERYYYTGKLIEGDHYYGYLVNGELVTDRFNTETAVVNGTTYSAYTYTTFNVDIQAEVTPSEIDYNDNAVLKLTLQADEAEQIEAVEAYADLSELGQSSSFAIDTELMEGTIALKEGVSTGVKNIPVTVKDQYGNLYTTTAHVTVKDRDNDGFDWDEAVIYFAVTDRFFDGDSSNNDEYGTGNYAPAEGSMYHGGDLAGLESKLDYLQNLGVNTVWITPIVENIEDTLDCDGYDGQHNSGYHGYWASDFTQLNRHLGTQEELQELIDALHARGMKLMVDVVLNHAGYGTEDIFNNTYIEGKNMLRDSSTTVKGDDKKDALSSLPDFVTEDGQVRDLLIAWQTSWVRDYDIDYFRVDTVKHVDDTTWKAFKNALTYIDPDFKMIGEYAGAGYATNAGQLKTGQMDSLLDFDFNDQAISFVSGNLSTVENFMESRNAGIDNTATMGSFLSSHDEDGLMYRLMNEGSRVDSDKAHALMKVAATLQITAKGQPVIYYGEELGQTGANNWPYQTNRYDMDWSIANDDNDMLGHYSKLLEIRNSYTDVFAKGSRTTVSADDANGTLVASRSYGDTTLYVGFNINENESRTVELKLAANTTYTDLYNNSQYQSDADGVVQIEIPAAQDGGTVVLKAGKAKPSDRPQIKNDSEETGNNESQSSESQDSESQSSDAGITTGRVMTEPEYTSMDGTTVTGWDKVIDRAFADAQAQMVPLSDSAESAATVQQTVVNLTLKSHSNMIIPKAVVAKMAASGATYVFSWENGVVTAYTASALAQIKGDLDLNIMVSKDKDFGQGFRSFVLEPRKKNIYGVKLATVMLLGKENAGKTAFIFHRNITTQQMEFLDSTIIDEAGHVAVPFVDFTDFVILYK